LIKSRKFSTNLWNGLRDLLLDQQILIYWVKHLGSETHLAPQDPLTWIGSWNDLTVSWSCQRNHAFFFYSSPFLQYETIIYNKVLQWNRHNTSFRDFKVSGDGIWDNVRSQNWWIESLPFVMEWGKMFKISLWITNYIASLKVKGKVPVLWLCTMPRRRAGGVEV